MTPVRVLDDGFVAVVTDPPTDATVVNAARVSFNKRRTGPWTDRDTRLIRYLAAHRHWTPFGHCRAALVGTFDRDTILRLLNAGGAFFEADGTTGDARLLSGRLSLSLAHATDGRLPERLFDVFRGTCPESVAALRAHADAPSDGPTPGAWTPCRWDDWPDQRPVTLHMRLPVFVARQWMRSNVGIVYNEVSRRYVDDEPTFHVPRHWRARPDDNIKQGSSMTATVAYAARAVEQVCADEYRRRLNAGIAPEQARACLPVSMYTEFWMTATTAALRRVLALRSDRHAQWESQEYARAVAIALEACPPNP